MESSDSLSSSQEQPRKWRRKKTHLTTGKKLRRHLSSDNMELLSSSGNSDLSTTGTQVTPVKFRAFGNQTFSCEMSSASTTTCDSPCEETFVQTENSSHKLLNSVDSLHPTIRDLISDGTLKSMCDILAQYNQLQDFRNLLVSIANGKIPPENICWLLNLHLGKYMTLDSTTQMRWHKDIVEFFSIVYILFGASAINVLRGPMHFSDIVMENVEKGKFDPSMSKINIPIPSINTIRNISTGYPKEIPVGLVQHTLDIAQQAKEKGCQYILSFDGKLVAKGFKGETYGDINLWGVEKPISLQATLDLLKRNIRTAERIADTLTTNTVFRRTMALQSLLTQVSSRIRNLRKSISGEHHIRLKIVKMIHNQTLDQKQRYSYKMQLSFLNEHSARCDSQIGRALVLNKRITKALSQCRKNLDVFSNQAAVELQKQNNAYFLFNVERNSNYFDLDLRENSDIVKQRSDKWMELRKSAKVTGSTLYKALGLSSLSDLKQHHYQFVKKRSPPHSLMM